MFLETRKHMEYLHAVDEELQDKREAELSESFVFPNW
jgi:hypothetical protein